MFKVLEQVVLMPKFLVLKVHISKVFMSEKFIPKTLIQELVFVLLV